MGIAKDELIVLAKATAERHGLDPVLVCAVVEQESFPPWNPWSMRAEPAFDAKYVRPLHLTPTEEWARSISWGLMQGMGQVARERGYTGPFPQLCQPEIGLEWGCVHLKGKLAAAGGDVMRGLEMWNGGGNPAYAAEVAARMEHYR